MHHSGNIPRLEYFHHQFEKLGHRFTDIERRLNDLNQKLENVRGILNNIEAGKDENSVERSAELKEIKNLLMESQVYQERIRKFRLPL